MEFALILPVFLLLLLIMLELGLAYSQRLTLTHATREGARTGSALAKGGATNCVVQDPAGVDQQIIAALQRIVKSPGSDVVLDDIDEVRIYKSDAAGGQVSGFVDIWEYAPVRGPDSTVPLSPRYAAEEATRRIWWRRPQARISERHAADSLRRSLTDQSVGRGAGLSG